MDLSIIVPVYNVEKYLSRCLDSIFSQDFKGDFEVIAVNDGSKDNSLEILKSFKEKYPKLKIIEQEINKSLAVARTTGIKQAEGTYILHVDSDDWIKPNMCSSLMKHAAANNDPDVIVFDYEKNNGINAQNSEKNITEKKCFTNENKISIQHLFMGACWNKLVKASLVKDLVYGNTYMNTTEDLIYSFEVFLKAKTILVIPETYYYYFFNNESLTTSITPSLYFDSQILVYSLLDEIKIKYSPSDEALNNVIVYLDNFLAVEFFKNHLLSFKLKNIPNDFLNGYKTFCGEKNLNFINRAYNGRTYSFRQVVSRFGLLNALKTIVKIKILR